MCSDAGWYGVVCTSCGWKGLDLYDDEHNPATYVCRACEDKALTASRDARIAELTAALTESIDLAEEGWGYADEYFRDKWEFAARRDALKAVLLERKPGGER